MCLQHLLAQFFKKARSAVLKCTTSQYSSPRKTFAHRCGNNSPTHMRGDYYTFSCLLSEVSYASNIQDEDITPLFFIMFGHGICQDRSKVSDSIPHSQSFREFSANISKDLLQFCRLDDEEYSYTLLLLSGKLKRT